MWIHQTENKHLNFVAPAGLSADQEVLFPVVDLQTPATAGTIAVTIKQQVTFIHIAGSLTEQNTLNLTIDSQVTKGALIHVKETTTTGQTYGITFGIGFTSPALVGVATKTKVMSFIYNGTAFFPLGASLQID